MFLSIFPSFLVANLYVRDSLCTAKLMFSLENKKIFLKKFYKKMHYT